MTRHIIILAIVLAGIVPFLATGTAQADNTLHCYDQSGFCVSNPTIWDYFQHRGGLATFGYPISQVFPFQGSQVQFFQRRIIQIQSNGQAGLLNVLDPGLMPYTTFNGATFPAIDNELVASAPGATDQAATIAWIERYVPDIWEGMPVNFFKTFINTVSCNTAYPNGNCQTQFIPGFNLEMWGIPTSLPMVDPNNHNFVYLRFQRGVMMYDASNGTTQGVLFGQYLKSIITEQNLPFDLAQEACGNQNIGPSPLCYQYYPVGYQAVRNPSALTNSNLTTAFVPDDPTTQAQLLSEIVSLGNCGRDMLMELYPNAVTEYSTWSISSSFPGPLSAICASGNGPPLGSFVYVGGGVKSLVYLAPGVPDAIAHYQQTYGPISLPSANPTPVPTQTPLPAPVPVPSSVPYPYPATKG